MFELRSAGDVLILDFSRKPRNRLLTIGTILVVAGIAFFAFLRRFPDLGLLFFLLAIVGAAIAIALLAVRAEAINVHSRFDKKTRTINVATRQSDGRGDSTALSFDDVRTLQLFQQRAKGTQTQTLTLVRRSGGTIFLGEGRQRSGWISPPYNDYLADIVERIRKETGVGGIEELPMPIQAAGSLMGVDRR